MLYRLLEEQVVPLFYERNEKGIPVSWVARVRASMTRLTPRYSSTRMMKEYVEKVYQPAAEAYRQRTADGARQAVELAAWQERLGENWNGLRFGRLVYSRENDVLSFQLEVYLGELSLQDVQVELYADPLGEKPAEKVVMARGDPLAGSVNGYHFSAQVNPTRPAEDYTPRIIACHEGAFVPLEEAHILWMR
ncbi:Maltodextrin phosphorylase [uncultured archaeon]|nr:Maltodextrin phosphorylase [uncultured archaeon]